MPADVIMPALGMAQETGKILRWLKREGDAVKKGEPLIEVETDKVTLDLEAPADGTLAGVRAYEGDEVPVGEVVAVVLAAGEELAAAAAGREPRLAREAEAPTAAAVVGDGRGVAAPPRRERRLASPKARRLAQARGVDIEALAGTGPNGAVVAADVEGLAGIAPARAVGATPGRVWRLMAERTAASWQSVPHFYLRRELDATRLLGWRDAASRSPGVERVTVTDLLVRVAAESLRRHPGVNASWREGTLVREERVNVAIAVATDDGLIAPVLHDADRLELQEIARRSAQLVAAARAAKLRPDDVIGATFTISNLGTFGVDEFDAIVVAPQAAILAVGRIAERPLVVDGRVVPRPTLRLTLSFDHRAVDGARGAEFLDTLASLIEEPAGLVR
jgi:pyruvate dehydrogenase E2 component (dihydrolipoyllysine-residue acetyltransferase)